MPASPASLDLDISASEPLQLKLGVKRTGLTADVEYTTNLQLSDDSGSLVKIPVIVTGISYAGLWVGDAAINKVNQPTQLVSPEAVKPTGSQFSYRLLVHMTEGGPARLLNQAIQMWDEAAGQFVILADDGLIGSFSGASLRDGQPVGRRISSPAFGNFYTANNATAYDGDKTQITFKELTATGGGFAAQNGELTATLFLPKDDPSNPFVHKFNPDHLTPDGTEAAHTLFDITRNIKLTFTDTDSDGNTILGSSALGWGSTQLGGRYNETMGGLLRSDRDIYIEGVFVLHRVSNIGTLTTAP